MLGDVRKVMKVHVHVTIRKDLMKWVDEKVKQGKYYNRTHALEQGLMEMKRKETVKL